MTNTKTRRPRVASCADVSLPLMVTLSAAQRRTLWRCLVPEIVRCRADLLNLRDTDQVDSPTAVFLRHELTHLLQVGTQLASPEVVNRSIERFENNMEVMDR